MDSDKKSGGGGSSGVSDGAAGGGVLVEDLSFGSESNRRRFCVPLKPGETTIVSWVKLLRDAGFHEGLPSPPPSPERPKRYSQDEASRSQCSTAVPKKEKTEPTDGSSTTERYQPKKVKTAPSETMDKNDVQATKNIRIGHARMKANKNYDDKRPLLGASVTSSIENSSDMSMRSVYPYGMILDRAAICAESRSTTLTSHNTEDYPLNNGGAELPDLNIPYAVQAANNSPTRIKDEAGVMVSGAVLENTILELQTMVAESRPPHREVQDPDHLVATKNRLPRELMYKLEIVVRLAHLSQGRISDELVVRLMGILGHWLKLRTLKRYLREMAPDDLLAGRGEDVSFCQIKTEVVEMIKLRVPSLGVKDGSCNGTVELAAAQKVEYNMDYEMEDKICDFYDVYVQGMDEVKSSEIRKFYIQVADLWPKGTMDNHGIRNAICRAKERRKMLLQEKVPTMSPFVLWSWTSERSHLDCKDG